MTFLLLYEVGALALFVTHRTNGLLREYKSLVTKPMATHLDGNKNLFLI
jgi:hypothetical protein